jgi:ribonuclease D
LIDSDEQIGTVIEAIKTEEVVGVDAERASGFKYGQDAYLIQLIADKVAFLVDPRALSGDAIKSLAAEVNTKEWILHSATQDLPCLNDLGLYPARIFDTEVAAKLSGFEKFGLAALVQEVQEIELKKEHSAADWSIRPLTQEMLEYAAQDVYYLKALRKALLVRLEELERLEFAEQEFAHLLKFKPKEIGPNPWRRCSGIHALTKPLQLARLREMWMVRDGFAIAQDIAPGRVVSDRSLSHAAAQEYKSIGDMKRDIREPSADTIPHHKNWQKLKPEVDETYKKLKAMLQDLAEETAIPVENIMSPSIIREALWRELHKDDLENFFISEGARQWQLGFVLPLFRDLL